MDRYILIDDAASSASSVEDVSEDAVIAINAHYLPEPLPLIETQRVKRLGVVQNSTIKRLCCVFFILVAAGHAIALWCHHGHGSYLPTASLSRLTTRLRQGHRGGFPSHYHTDEPITPDPAKGIIIPPVISTRNTIIELEHQLKDLTDEISEDENDGRKLDLLIELLKSHVANSNDEAAAEVEQRLRGMATYQVGDVVEQLYNANTMRNRVLHPFRIEDVHFTQHEEGKEAGAQQRRLNEDRDEDDEESDGSDDNGSHNLSYTASTRVGIRYTIVRLLDGYRLANIPESFLRLYVPYENDTSAICNLGGLDIGQELSVPCSIVEYVPNIMMMESSKDTDGTKNHVRIKEEEESMTKAEYRVRMKRAGDSEEIEENMSMGKIQRLDRRIRR